MQKVHEEINGTSMISCVSGSWGQGTETEKKEKRKEQRVKGRDPR